MLYVPFLAGIVMLVINLYTDNACDSVCTVRQGYGNIADGCGLLPVVHAERRLMAGAQTSPLYGGGILPVPCNAAGHKMVQALPQACRCRVLNCCHLNISTDPIYL